VKELYIQLHKNIILGSSSEKIDAAQLELLLQFVQSLAGSENKPPAAEKSSAPVRERKELAPRVPANLPVVEQVIEPQEVLKQPEQWRLIGLEVSDQLDYEPARFLCRRVVRKKYVHVSDPDRAPVIGPLLVQKGRPLSLAFLFSEEEKNVADFLFHLMGFNYLPL
jgi:transposase